MSTCGKCVYHDKLKIVPSMQAKLREAARDGRRDVIIDLLKHGVDVNGADAVSHVIRSYVKVHVHV